MKAQSKECENKRSIKVYYFIKLKLISEINRQKYWVAGKEKRFPLWPAFEKSLKESSFKISLADCQ